MSLSLGIGLGLTISISTTEGEDTMTFLTTIDLSNDATAEFTGFDATKYDGYIFIFGNILPITDGATLNCHTSSDGGSSYDSGASDYAYAGITHRSVSADAPTKSAGTSFVFCSAGVGTAAGEDGVSGQVTLMYPHLAKRTQIGVSTMFYRSDGEFGHMSLGGVRKSSADVDAIRFSFSTGNIASGTITMYGLRNA